MMLLPATALAQSSETYQLKSYGFGSGGVATSSSESYNAFGLTGEDGGQQLSSETYKANSGLTYTILANVPPAPTLSNPATNYDRLKFVLATDNNPSTTQYAIQISSDNFASDIRYIQNDDTVGATLGNEDWQTYTSWGGASEAFVTRLSNNTTYKIRAKARVGSYTESAWGPASSGIATSNPSLTFSLDSNTITFSSLNASNSYTDASKTTVLTTSTNAYNGYIVYAKETQPLTAPDSSTISDFGASNSSPTTWSGNGFGYTTSDSDLTGGTNNRFSGSKYAGFTTTASSNPVADHTGPVESTAISSEQFTISYRVTTPSTQQAGTYDTTIQYIIVPSY
jgi:hypothetical protein